MAVVGSHLTGSASTSTATSYATASISPAANALVLVAVGSNLNSGTPNQPTISGASMTWVAIATQLSADNHQRITIFRGMSASPGSGALTIDFSGQTQDGLTCWQVDSFTGIDTSGSNGSGAIIQNAGNTNNGVSTGLTVTLNAFADGNNATYGAVYVNGVLGISAGSGFTELGNNASGGTEETEYKSVNDTTVDWSWSSTSVKSSAIALEIQAEQGHFMTMQRGYW